MIQVDGDAVDGCQSETRSPRLTWVMVAVGLTMAVAVAAIAPTGLAWWSGPTRSSAALGSAVRQGPERQALEAAHEFVETAVARRRLVLAWRLAAPSLRLDLTASAWLSGSIPVPSYPVAEAKAVYVVEATRPGRTLVRVVFEPLAHSTAEWGVYDLGLVLEGGRWLVASCRGGAYGCRHGGERDPDPGPRSLWC